MDDFRRLEGLAAAAYEVALGEPPELLVDQGQQLVGSGARGLLPLRNGGEDLGDAGPWITRHESAQRKLARAPEPPGWGPNRLILARFQFGLTLFSVFDCGFFGRKRGRV